MQPRYSYMLAASFWRCHPLRALGCIAILVGLFVPAASHADENLRNSFPGRRVSGGTRGVDCVARLLVHLAPANSVFAPGASDSLAILQGTTTRPTPVSIVVKPYPSGGDSSEGRSVQVTLPAGPASVVVFDRPAAPMPITWESAFQCDSATPAQPRDLGLSSGSYVQSLSPSPITLLIADETDEDRSIQNSLSILRQRCGSSLSVNEVVSLFSLSLAEELGPNPPESFPVRCL